MNLTDVSLFDQLQMTDAEIVRRKELVGLGLEEISALIECKPLVEMHIDEIIGDFMRTQTAVPEIVQLLGDSESTQRMTAMMRRYVLDLFGGYFDEDYVTSRLYVGLVRKRLGIESKYYIAATSKLKAVIADFLQRQAPDSERFIGCMAALDRLLDFDMTLVMDSYLWGRLTAAETAKSRVEEYARALEEKVATRTRQLEEMAHRDPLTNLYNRRALMDSLRREIAQAKRRKHSVSLLYLDVDNFRNVNDALGHFEGDELIKHIAHAIINSVREIDVAGRFGSDEFCVILSECGVHDAAEVCNRIIERFTTNYPNIGLSIGVAQTGPMEFIGSEELLRYADKKLFEAKQAGGRIVVT